MVNYHEPDVVLQGYLTMSKIWHFVAGLYFWEFVTTLDYEWSVIRGHRPFRWTIWIYSASRISTLIAIILGLVRVDVITRYNCEVKVVFQLFFGYLAIASASLLIVLRIIAIWNKNKIIIAIAAGAWVINAILQIQSIAQIRTTWISGIGCLTSNLHILELNVLAALISDIILLVIMFFGLLRLGFHERSAFGLGRLLWKQGVIWLLVATIAEVLPTVFLILDFNNPFLLPSTITLSIAATRIHRALVDSSFGRNEPSNDHLSELDNSKRSGHIECKANSVPIKLSRAVMARNGTSDQTPQTSQNSCIEGQLCDEKPGRQRGLDESTESDVESQAQVSS